MSKRLHSTNIINSLRHLLSHTRAWHALIYPLPMQHHLTSCNGSVSSQSELIRIKDEMEDLNSKIKVAAADHDEDAIPRLRKKFQVQRPDTDAAGCC